MRFQLPIDVGEGNLQEEEEEKRRKELQQQQQQQQQQQLLQHHQLQQQEQPSPNTPGATAATSSLDALSQIALLLQVHAHTVTCHKPPSIVHCDL